MDAVALKGLERVISVTIGGSAVASSSEAQASVEGAVSGNARAAISSLIHPDRQRQQDFEEEKNLPPVHFRTYTVGFLRSGLPTPIVQLSPHGPHFSFEMRRTQQPEVEVWKQAMKKTVKKSTAQLNGTRNKNIDIDEMGDKVGRVYVDNQDLSKLQARKFKGLKRHPDEKKKSYDEPQDGDEVAEVDANVGGGEGRKRVKVSA